MFGLPLSDNRHAVNLDVNIGKRHIARRRVGFAAGRLVLEHDVSSRFGRAALSALDLVVVVQVALAVAADTNEHVVAVVVRLVGKGRNDLLSRKNFLIVKRMPRLLACEWFCVLV